MHEPSDSDLGIAVTDVVSGVFKILKQFEPCFWSDEFPSPFSSPVPGAVTVAFDTCSCTDQSTSTEAKDFSAEANPCFHVLAAQLAVPVFPPHSGSYSFSSGGESSRALHPDCLRRLDTAKTTTTKER